MSKTILTMVFILFIMTILAPRPSQAWLIYHKPAFKGKVIDAETKKPIEGAVVVVVYEKIVAGLGPGWSAFPFMVRETLTDSEGVFQIPSYTTVIQPFSINSFVNFIIYKPGYGHYHPDGINLEDTELFFSEYFGEERRIKLLTGSVREGTGPHRTWSNVIFGVVELPRLKSKEERRNVWFSANIFDHRITKQDLPILYNFIKEEELYINN